MSDYTPTTDEVRDRYAWGRSDVGYVSYDEAEAEFDLWLAAHDATVRAEERARMSQRALDPVFGVPFDHDHDVAIVSAWITDEIHASAYPHHEEHCRSGSCGVRGGS